MCMCIHIYIYLYIRKFYMNIVCILIFIAKQHLFEVASHRKGCSELLSH